MTRLCIVAGAILAGIAVAAGAFGAHGLRAFLEARQQAGNWETAARYALVHALALVVVGAVAALPQAAATQRTLAAAAICFLAGVAIFSGCLAALAVTGVKVLGAIVPVGGLLLIAGWALLALAGWRIGR